MIKDYIIGLDVGTSGVKALAFTFNGKLLATGKQYYETLPSQVEHDPDIIYKATLKCLNNLVKQIGFPPAATGICTFLHSLMPVDNKIRPLGNLRLWNDNRSASTALILKGSSECSEIYMKTGTPVHPMSPLIKIKHIKDTESDLFNKARYFIGIKEYLLYKLTGNLAIDYSIASGTGLFDSDKKVWCDQAMDWCGIKKDSLADIADPEMSMKCRINGLLKDLTIIPGLSDGCAANLGSASIDNTELTITLGTSAAIRFTDKQKRCDPSGILFSYCLDDKMFVTGGASNNCYNVIDNLLRELRISINELNNQDITKITALKRSQDNIGGRLFYMPWMFGERAPLQLFKPVYGFINSIPSDSSEKRLISAIEGIIFNIKSIGEKLTLMKGNRFERIHIGGGLSQFPIVREILTSVFNLPLVEHESGEGSAIGTALYTAMVLGIVNDFKESRGWNPELRTYMPDKHKSEYYNSAYQDFVKAIADYQRNE